MCKSTEVYVNETHTVGLMLEGARNKADTVGINCLVYICKDCNFIALYANSVVFGLIEDIGWKKVA